MRDELSELLEVLDDRERKIIFQRFGLDGGKPKTLEEAGKKFGVTRDPQFRISLYNLAFHYAQVEFDVTVPLNIESFAPAPSTKLLKRSRHRMRRAWRLT
jgi:hypothetical protein